jgi:hypothetical protein
MRYVPVGSRLDVKKILRGAGTGVRLGVVVGVG